MAPMVRPASAATKGNPLTTPYQPTLGPVEIERSVASDGKPRSLVLLNEAIDASGVPRKVLAADCGMSEAQFSRLTSGAQGFPIGLLDLLPAAIVLDYLDRMAHARGAHVEREDAAVIAAARLVEAALAFMRARGRTGGLPEFCEVAR